MMLFKFKDNMVDAIYILRNMVSALFCYSLPVDAEDPDQTGR